MKIIIYFKLGIFRKKSRRQTGVSYDKTALLNSFPLCSLCLNPKPSSTNTLSGSFVLLNSQTALCSLRFRIPFYNLFASHDSSRVLISLVLNFKFVLVCIKRDVMVTVKCGDREICGDACAGGRYVAERFNNCWIMRWTRRFKTASTRLSMQGGSTLILSHLLIN